MGKRKRSNGCGIWKISKANDHISGLHDNILSSILSLLPLRDAVKTSALSSRWRHLWKHIFHLNFDGDSILTIDTPNGTPCQELNESQDALLRKRASKFIRLVHKILRCHMGIGVETFSVQMFLHKNYAQDLDKLIDFAIASRTKELHLKLGGSILSIRYDPYEFPCNFFSGGRGSSLMCLSLQYCSFRPPHHFDGFNSLKALDLHDVSVTEIDVQNLISGCLVLERLSFFLCNQLANLKISHTCPQLKHLKVDLCCILRNIELCAPNLVSFVYRGSVISFTMKNATQLIRADISFHSEGWNDLCCFLAGLPVNLPQLETLFIHFDICFETGILAMSSNKFSHLKHLMLTLDASSEYDFLWVASFLNAAHLIETLELQLTSRPNYDIEPREIKRPSKCSSYNHLRSILINGFTGELNQIELAIYLLNHSPVLELMTLNPANKMHRAQDVTSFHTFCYPDSGMACDEGSKYLLGEVPSSVQLMIL